MPILEQNIQFLESQIMDDVPEGGGAATGRVIPDGVMNNVFEDISDLDRAMGRINLRKLFVGVRSLDTDLYGGAKLAITALPEDPAIGYTVFTTGDAFDTRAQAADRVESYLFKGPMWPGALYENHIEGMRSINVIQRVGTALPPIGKTLCLVQLEGQAGEKEQYVRVIDVEVSQSTFTDSQGDYQRWVVTMELSDALRHDFTGHTPNRSDSYNYSTGVRLRDTTVADATRYYGAHALQVSAEIGDLEVKLPTMFAQLVPAAQAETPLVSQTLNPELSITVDAGTREVDVPQQAHTLARPVTAENRRFNWVETLSPIPAPGGFSISYMAQGNWYTLVDDGNGVISGSDPSFGSGTINYVSGAMSTTLGALPDVSTQILMIWGSPVHYTVYAGHEDIDTTVRIEHDLGEAVSPGTLELTWLSGAVTKTATGAVSGAITGDATGYISHVTGEFWIELAATPDPESQLGIDYERLDEVQVTFTEVGESGGLATIDVDAAMEPGSVRVEWVTESVHVRSQTVIEREYSFNGVVVRSRVDEQAGVTKQRHRHIAHDDDGDIVDENGSVNYATGDIVVPVLPSIREVQWSYSSTGDVEWKEWVGGSDVHSFASGVINVWYAPAGASTTEVSIEIDIPPVRLRVLPRLITDRVVPNSLEFTFNGKTYEDRNGTLYTDIDPGTGSGVVAGEINYASGVVEIDYYASGGGTVVITSLLGVFGDWHSIDAAFRTISAPIKPESLQIVAVTADGEQLIATSDQDGLFDAEYIQGEVNYTFGTCFLTFGKLVSDASLTEAEKDEDWYDAGNVVGGMIYQPREIMPGSTIYNAVSYTYIPLDADILGIDAVRLPADGRVPVYRPGDVVMVMHPEDTAPVTPTLDGDEYVVDLGRTRIGWVRVIDDDGETVTEGFTLDRANGLVSWETLDGLATPVVIRHTVADLRLVVDAQISGQLTLARPLSHPFPADETIVSSCLLWGDRRARVSATWDQSSWNSTWVDSIVGSAATATLNLIDFPITVTNEGCDTDRWVLRWTSTTAAELISEKRGLVWSGTWTVGGDDIAPINPRTRGPDGEGGVPYMTIPGDANGGGWSAGNVVRINTVGAIADFWIARAIQQSDEPLDDGADGCEIYALGNVDNP